jgi:hypothetical protein
VVGGDPGVRDRCICRKIAHVSRLVDRWGRTGFAAATSLVWLLPMAAWAGSVDLGPNPGTGPWVAFALGLVLLAAWLVLLTRLGHVPVADRPRRWDIQRMSSAERAWNLGLAVCVIAIIGWLNAAATVDWNLLTPGLRAGRGGAVALAGALAVFVLAALGCAIYSWRCAGSAFRARRASAAP